MKFFEVTIKMQIKSESEENVRQKISYIIETARENYPPPEGILVEDILVAPAQPI